MMAHIISLHNRISCVVGISIFGFNTYWKWVFNLMDIKNNTNLKTVLVIQNTQRQEKQVTLSIIQFQKTEILPQAGNDKTTNLKERNCKAKWDGLYSRDTVSKKSHKHGQSKGTHNEQPGKSADKKNGAGVTP